MAVKKDTEGRHGRVPSARARGKRDGTSAKEGAALVGTLMAEKATVALPGTTKEITIEQMEALGTRLLATHSNAAYLGLSEDGFHGMLRQRPELRMALKRGRAKVFAKVSNVVLRAALDGNMFAAMKILALKDGWRDQMVGNTTPQDNDGEPITVADGEQQVTSGVLLLPRGIDSIEDWERQHREQMERLKDVAHGSGEQSAAAAPATESGVDPARGQPA